MKIKNILYFGILLLFTGCMGEVINTDAYILGYCEINSLNASSCTTTIGGEEHLGIAVWTSDITMVADAFDEDLTLFKKYRKEHNDYGYDKHCINNPIDFPGRDTYPCYDFIAVDVTCDKAIDEKHPAGTSLGDLFYYVATTNRPFIDNNYTGYDYDSHTQSAFFNYRGAWGGIQEFYPVDKPLCDVTPADLMMPSNGEYTHTRGLGDEFVYDFADDARIGTFFIPTSLLVSGSTLTFTYTKDDYEELSACVTIP